MNIVYVLNQSFIVFSIKLNETIKLLITAVAPSNKKCLRPLEHWVRGFVSHSTHGLYLRFFCVCCHM
jgi:hypothetical protein